MRTWVIVSLIMTIVAVIGTSMFLWNKSWSWREKRRFVARIALVIGAPAIFFANRYPNFERRKDGHIQMKIIEWTEKEAIRHTRRKDIAKKALLRAEIADRIRSMPKVVRREEDAILTQHAQLLLPIRTLSQGSLVLGYAALEDEVQMDDLWLHLLSRGIRLAFPRADAIEVGWSGHPEMTFHSITTWPPDSMKTRGEWEKDKWGIWTPKRTCPLVRPEEVSLAILPGRAFSPDGRRLGRGGGFYDRFLPTLPKETPVIAFAYDEQIVDDIPSEPHDCKVDWIITPTREWRGDLL